MNARIVVAALAFGFIVGGSVIPSVAAIGCTEIGTSESDEISGSRGRDVLCGLAGNDYLAGRAGDDVLRGGSGNDTLVGHRGGDALRGGGGNDRIFSVDDAKRNDVLLGGPGQDSCYADGGDRARCELVFRGTGPMAMRIILALSNALGGSISLAEELVSVLPGPTGPTGPAGPPGPTKPFPPATPPPCPPPPPPADPACD